ncbi:MAG: pyridoxine 5'-phosphate synthase [Flavobacteriales bacterium]
MTKLSVNINKIATLRNARGGDFPNIIQVAKDCESFGAEGITVHPRPDERHIRYQDVRDLKPIVKTEFNIEGNPTASFIDLVLENKPHQVTLVPDGPEAITSNAGWDTKSNISFLTEVITEFKNHGIRTSIFLNPTLELVEYAAKSGADRIELYTEDFAKKYQNGNPEAIEPYKNTAVLAKKMGLGVNAGHDLSLDNIEFLIREIPQIDEVSIGHALIGEALYLGLENTIGSYLNKIKRAYSQ